MPVGLADILAWMKWIIAILAALAILALIVHGISDKPRPPSAAATAPSVVERPQNIPSNYDPAQKELRASVIGKFQEQGVFGDIRVSNHVGKVVAGKLWPTATADQKRDFAFVAYCWCLDNDPQCNALIVSDKHSGNEVAEFTMTRGLKIAE